MYGFSCTSTFLKIYQLIFVITLICLPNIGHYRGLIRAQDGLGFEIPIQLIGFPVIIAAVRTSNFVRKLAYALSPSTYSGRSSRKVRGAEIMMTQMPMSLKGASEELRYLNTALMDKELLRHAGDNYCVYEKVCLKHVHDVANDGHPNNWTEIINNYNHIPSEKQQFYLLSVSLGNIFKSYELCRHFRQNNRVC